MSKIRGMVLGSFVGDALALGPHWIYNIEDIKEKFGQIDGLTSPGTGYHKGKIKGDFTHYGDQALMLFQYVKLHVNLEKEPFYNHYKDFMKSYEGYLDHATKETLENLSRDILNGSHSSELGGFTRYTPIIFMHQNDRQKGLEQVLLQTKYTHDNEILLERVDFLTQLTYRVLKGESPTDVVMNLKKTVSKTLFDDIEFAKNMVPHQTAYAMKQLGQSCDSDYAFPAVLYFVMKYEDDLKNALLENVYAGGDSAARGMVIGAILGAYHGEEKIPVNWLASMNQLKTLENLLMT